VGMLAATAPSVGYADISPAFGGREFCGVAVTPVTPATVMAGLDPATATR
jgi:hypothetical protein